jgi:PPK2 family polyphosphate:nucleotide phosphotransferase
MTKKNGKPKSGRTRPDADELKLLARFRAEPGRSFRLKDHDPGWTGPHGLLEALGEDELKARAKAILEANRAELAAAQELLYANDTWSVLLVLQAMDAAGKDGTIKHVMSGVNPQGVHVTSFKRPSDEELDHDFLWRCSKALPERGRIGIFNRSYYEEVLVVRVHPEYLGPQKLPPGKRGDKFWNARYDDINAFERHLVRNGTLVVKVFLNVSRAEQKRRFLARIDDPAKNWKFAAADVAERAHWDAYMDAYESMIRATSTEWAPWYVIPADHKYVARASVAALLTNTIQGLGLSAPKPTESQMKSLAAAKASLLAERD